RYNTQFSLTEARWQRFGKLLKQYDGWAAALRGGYGNEAVNFMAESGVLDEQIDDGDALVKLLSKAETNGKPFTTEVLSQNPAEIVIRSIERKSGLARTHKLRVSLLDAHEYRQLVRLHEQLVSTAGTPPFNVSLGER